jgi:hypothetical protein
MPQLMSSRHGWPEMTLHCRACRGVHTFAVGDVERIVYALAAATESLGDPLAPAEPPCLLVVARWSDDPAVYAEHVDQGVTCRRGVI